MAGFDVNLEPGKLVFDDGYVIPNRAVRFAEDSTLGLWFRTLVGDDVEVVDGTVLYPRVAKATRGDLSLEVSHHADSSGDAATDRVRQLKENLAELATIADLTASTGSQTVTYTPWVGATPLDVTAVVLAPLVGTVLRGVGVRVGVVMVVEAAVAGDGA